MFGSVASLTRSDPSVENKDLVLCLQNVFGTKQRRGKVNSGVISGVHTFSGGRGKSTVCTSIHTFTFSRVYLSIYLKECEKYEVWK